jgi:hypothetical protein
MTEIMPSSLSLLSFPESGGPSMRKVYLLFVLTSLLSPAAAQIKTIKDTLSHEKFLALVNFSKTQSYVTFGNGLGNQIPILFEAKLSPNYFVTNHNRRWALMLNPEVQIRMLDQKSFPIQVPSYRFFLTYYRGIDFWDKTFLKKLFYNDAIWFVSLAHHSNGQNGKFYLNDTTKTIAVNNGSFATNFFLFGISTYGLRPSGSKYYFLKEAKIHAEIHPWGWSDHELKKIYGFYRVFATFGFAGPWRQEKENWLNQWLQHSSIEFQTGWIFGALRGHSPADVSKRLIVDVNYKYYPTWFDEIAFFVRFYSGQDYYNIYFERQLTTLSVGITSNTFKVSNAIKYLGDKKTRRIMAH